jgi:hypothetical protein
MRDAALEAYKDALRSQKRDRDLRQGIGPGGDPIRLRQWPPLRRRAKTSSLALGHVIPDGASPSAEVRETPARRRRAREGIPSRPRRRSIWHPSATTEAKRGAGWA